MKIHKGHYQLRDDSKEPTVWVETTVTLKPGPRDLLNALGSKYLRYEVSDEEGERPRDLPERLSQREILKIYREELLYQGSDRMELWGDFMDADRQAACEVWLREIVDAAFPEMKGYAR